MAIFHNIGGGNYEVITSSSPDYINEIALYLFNTWKSFAEGGASINGRRIENPTGRLAASISVRGDGKTAVTVEATAKHALYLELGHGPIDMKKYLKQGKSYPMHRGARMFSGFSPPVPNSKKPDMLAWVIPAMRPYAPAEFLAKLAAKVPA